MPFKLNYLVVWFFYFFSPAVSAKRCFQGGTGPSFLNCFYWQFNFIYSVTCFLSTYLQLLLKHLFVYNFVSYSMSSFDRLVRLIPWQGQLAYSYSSSTLASMLHYYHRLVIAPKWYDHNVLPTLYNLTLVESIFNSCVVLMMSSLLQLHRHWQLNMIVGQANS